MGLGDDGRGGPRGGHPRPHARGRAATCVPVVIDDETYRQAYDVVANTTLWYCHHHLFDLPHRPRFDRSLAGGLGGLPGLQPGHGRRRRGAGGRRATPCSCRTTTSRCSGGCWPRRARTCARCTSCTRRSPRPTCSRVLPDDVVAELLDGMAGYAACGFHCHQWEAAFLGLLRRRPARGAHRRPSWPRSAPTPACSRRRPLARLRRGGDALRCRGGRSSHHRPHRPHGAVEEHRAGDARLRGAADRATPSGAAGSCTSRSPIPSRQGLAEYLAYAADVEHTAARINHCPGGRTAGRRLCSRSTTTGPARSPR